MFIPLLFAAEVVATIPDCGEATHKDLITKTKALIVRTAPLEFTSESVSLVPESCARLEFTISREGKAENIRVTNAYKLMVIGRAALYALPQYQFKDPGPGHEKDIYTLVIWGPDWTNPKG